jgi:aspartate/glutamate racemase
MGTLTVEATARVLRKVQHYFHNRRGKDFSPKKIIENRTPPQ